MKRLFCLLMLTVLALGTLAGCGGQTKPIAMGDDVQGNVALNGSTSMEKAVGILSESFMAKHKLVKITYDATGSGTGIEAVANGRCDIGLASRDLKNKEKQLGLKSETLARDGIAIIVHKDAKLDSLSVKQVSDIFSGKISSWQTVDGRNGRIACIGREAGSGTRDGFESITKTGGKCKLAQELTSTGAVLEAVKNNPQAMGYVSYASVIGKKDIKVLKIDGVECTAENISGGKYVVQRPFNLILKDGAKLSPQAEAFLKYALSKENGDLLKKAGVVPAVR